MKLFNLNCITKSCIWNNCVTWRGTDYELPEDDTIVSKHVEKRSVIIYKLIVTVFFLVILQDKKYIEAFNLTNMKMCPFWWCYLGIFYRFHGATSNKTVTFNINTYHTVNLKRKQHLCCLCLWGSAVSVLMHERAVNSGGAEGSDG